MRLDEGQTLPSFTASVVDGDDLDLPDDLEGVWSILLFYRGRW